MIKNISSFSNISLDNVCTLIKCVYISDDCGDQTETETENICFCAELPITSSEFYNAGQSGIKPEKMLIVESECYNGEKLAVYDNVRYDIYRVYPKDNGYTELYLKIKGGV